MCHQQQYIGMALMLMPHACRDSTQYTVVNIPFNFTSQLAV
jgi:hypothetical protein